MLAREVARSARELGLAARPVLVAVSGGVDSTALAHALRALPQGWNLKLSIGHVNHGLRGVESEADEAAVRELAAALEVPVRVARGDPSPLRSGRSSRDRLTLQEAARACRYAALRRMALELGCAHIATAHHADDQAETLMLRLFRGTGPDGLGGIPERSSDGVVVRPLLRVSRAEIEAYAHGHGLRWREDRSNADPRYTRNRLRSRVLPDLAQEFNPRLLRALADLAEAQRRDAEWIGAQVEREAASRLIEEGGWLRIESKDWPTLPSALSRRLIRRALVRGGAARHVTRTHLERVDAFLAEARVGTAIELPGGLTLRRDRSGVRLGPLP